MEKLEKLEKSERLKKSIVVTLLAMVIPLGIMWASDCEDDLHFLIIMLTIISTSGIINVMGKRLIKERDRNRKKVQWDTDIEKALRGSYYNLGLHSEWENEIQILIARGPDVFNNRNKLTWILQDLKYAVSGKYADSLLIQYRNRFDLSDKCPGCCGWKKARLELCTTCKTHKRVSDHELRKTAIAASTRPTYTEEKVEERHYFNLVVTAYNHHIYSKEKEVYILREVKDNWSKYDILIFVGDFVTWYKHEGADYFSSATAETNNYLAMIEFLVNNKQPVLKRSNYTLEEGNLVIVTHKMVKTEIIYPADSLFEEDKEEKLELDDNFRLYYENKISEIKRREDFNS